MRKVKAIAVLAATLFVWFPQALSAQHAATAQVTIRVSEPTGTGVAHALVQLVPAPENAPANPETDEKGRITFNLKAGGYVLSVSASGFSNWAQRINVVAAQGQAGASQIVPVVLQIGDVSSPTPVYPQNSLVITAGADHEPLTLSPADFRALPHVTVTVRNGHTNASETYSGVPLATLLDKMKAPLGEGLRGDAMTSYIVASGSDGYSVVLSLAEVDPDLHQGQVLVADTRDGKPLEKNGPFQLVVSDDKRPARWVHNLTSITLQRSR
jgi:hypothetical protein